MKQVLLLTMFFLISMTTYAGCEKLSAAKDARLIDRIDNRDYSYRAVADMSHYSQDICISNSYDQKTGKSQWVEFKPSVATLSAIDSDNSSIELSICNAFIAQQASWIRSIYYNLQSIDSSIELSFRVQNANSGGKLKRDIICTPKVLGFVY